MLNLISVVVLLSSLFTFNLIADDQAPLSEYQNISAASILVENADSVLFSYQPDLALTPASLMKILSGTYLLVGRQPSSELVIDLRNVLSASDNKLLEKIYQKNRVKDPLVTLRDYAKKYSNSKFLIKDLGGKDPENRLSCEVIVQILKSFSSDLVFRGLLAVPGEGTLQSRVDLPSALQAKTGSLRGVRNLAVYLKTKANQELVFCMINNEADNDEAAVKLETKLVNWLWNNY